MNEITIFSGMGTTALSVVQAVLPLVAILMIFQVLFLKLPRSYVINLLKGTLISSVGLLLFLQGVQTGFLPFGQAIGGALGSFEQKWLLLPIGFLLGFFTAFGEPAVRVLCNQVEEASAGSINKTAVLYAICVGVAIFVALGMVRIIYSIPLIYILVPGYSIAILMLWFSQKAFVSIAFDAGGVATGPITNTFLLGLGLGVASVNGDRDLITYGFGLAALISLAPIISVMAVGIIIRIRIRYRG